MRAYYIISLPPRAMIRERKSLYYFSVTAGGFLSVTLKTNTALIVNR